MQNHKIIKRKWEKNGFLTVSTFKTCDPCHYIRSTTNGKTPKLNTQQIKCQKIKLRKKSITQKIIIKRMRMKIKIKIKIN